MRYTEDHKDRSRARIVGSASKLLRRHGIASVTVAAAMKDAGLTHGAFYAHFASKDALVAESLRHAMDETLGRLRDAVAGKAGRAAFEALLDAYLADWQLAKPWNGCAVANLSQEVSRADPDVRHALFDRAEQLVEFIAGLMPDKSASARASRATGIFSTMVGAISLAQLTQEPRRRAAVLSSARATALRAWDAP